MLHRSTNLEKAVGTFERRSASKYYLFRWGWEDVRVLEGIAAWIWESLEQRCAFGELVADAAHVLEIDPAVAFSKLEELVGRLIEAEAICVVD